MEENNFKVGDVVQLKSGGPKMTVLSKYQDDENEFVCTYFYKNEMKKDIFNYSVLKKVVGIGGPTCVRVERA